MGCGPCCRQRRVQVEAAVEAPVKRKVEREVDPQWAWWDQDVMYIATYRPEDLPTLSDLTQTALKPPLPPALPRDLQPTPPPAPPDPAEPPPAPPPPTSTHVNEAPAQPAPHPHAAQAPAQPPRPEEPRRTAPSDPRWSWWDGDLATYAHNLRVDRALEESMSRLRAVTAAAGQDAWWQATAPEDPPPARRWMWWEGSVEQYSDHLRVEGSPVRGASRPDAAALFGSRTSQEVETQCPSDDAVQLEFGETWTNWLEEHRLCHERVRTLLGGTDGPTLATPEGPPPAPPPPPPPPPPAEEPPPAPVDEPPEMPDDPLWSWWVDRPEHIFLYRDAPPVDTSPPAHPAPLEAVPSPSHGHHGGDGHEAVTISLRSRTGGQEVAVISIPGEPCCLRTPSASVYVAQGVAQHCDEVAASPSTRWSTAPPSPTALPSTLRERDPELAEFDDAVSLRRAIQGMCDAVSSLELARMELLPTGQTAAVDEFATLAGRHAHFADEEVKHELTIEVQNYTGLAESVLSFKVGESRRQSSAGTMTGRRLTFTNPGTSEAIDLTVYEVLASGSFVLHPCKDCYRLLFKGAHGGADVNAELKVKGHRSPSKSGAMAELSSEKLCPEVLGYFESHQLLQYIPALCVSAFQEAAEDPYAFMQQRIDEALEAPGIPLLEKLEEGRGPLPGDLDGGSVDLEITVQSTLEEGCVLAVRLGKEHAQAKLGSRRRWEHNFKAALGPLTVSVLVPEASTRIRLVPGQESYRVALPPTRSRPGTSLELLARRTPATTLPRPPAEQEIPAYVERHKLREFAKTVISELGKIRDPDPYSWLKKRMDEFRADVPAPPP